MKKKEFLFFAYLVFQLAFFSAKAQLNDSFSDGDFSVNPSWTGNASDWIVNSSSQLQSNNTVINSNFYLSTDNLLATTAQWEFWCQISFNPSSANYIDVYLTASASDVTQASTTGYFVKIGNTNDEISLYRKNADGSSTLIIDGADGILNTSNNVMKIKVIRDAANQWTLFRDLTGTGNSYVSEGSVIDATFTTSSFFSIWVHQSTASFFQKHFFDDIEVKPYVPDTTPPSIQSVTAASANTLDVLFSEPVDPSTSQTLTNYSVNNRLGNPTAATLDASNNSVMHLSFANNFSNGVLYTITINGVQDLSGNAVSNGNSTFSYYTAQRYDVVIDEIMADPAPQVGLPDNEWLELKNTSTFPINLAGWRISDATNTSGTLPNFILQPDSFVIVCTNSAVAAMSAFGATISVTSFPSLDNTGDQLSLSDAGGQIIHAVSYSDAWYQNELKKDGGWTLEMIDTKSPCSGRSNWNASIDPQGGTPGRKNSIEAVIDDQTPPQLKRTYTIDSVTIVAVFDEPVDSTQASEISNYAIDKGLATTSAIPLSPLFDKVRLRLNSEMQAGTVYNLTVSNLTDCKGNSIGSFNQAKAGLPVDANASDIVVNEILFNPQPNGSDFVEYYNRSNKIFDASKLFAANRNSSNVISSITQINSVPWLVFPGEYPVVTTDANSLQQNYFVKNPDWILTPSSLPSMPDNNGYAVLLNQQGNVVDEVNYDHSWHFKLIDNEDGVSLERVDPDGSSQDANNWHSAASTVGYATPTYMNSQFKQIQNVNATILVVPKVFSPDNDGHDDITTIQYKMADPGYVANITIFDAGGRPVRYLVKNNTLALNGYWNWDGLDEKGNRLPIGTYVIYTEIFNLQGKRQHFKNVVVLARKLD